MSPFPHNDGSSASNRPADWHVDCWTYASKRDRASRVKRQRCGEMRFERLRLTGEMFTELRLGRDRRGVHVCRPQS